MFSHIVSVRVAALAMVVATGVVSCADSPPGTRTGMYTYMADAAVFEDCTTGTRYPVLIEAAHIDVERAYLEQRAGPGEPLWLAARFELVERAPEPGMPVREHLRVLEFDRFEPGRGCAR